MRNKSYLHVFLVAFLSMISILFPNILFNHGLFLYAGDYYYQQIPFYCHAIDVLRDYGIGWDWYTDLGSDFITSYSYYLTGSIFFWMISWLSSDMIIYAMPVMIAFKTAVGAVGAYVYISRYIKSINAAAIGAFMYAFSGYQMTSLVFNTFHDITALFPFLLYAFDLLVLENKKSFFSFMVALIALTNYFFFVGIAIFVILYYIIKCTKKEFEFNIRSFATIALETIIGLGISAVILLPTFIVLSSASRVNDTLYGVDLISYSDNTIIPKILQSFFVMPDSPSNGMLFKSLRNENNWASISLYLPVFTITAVVSYINKNKNDWLSITLKISFVIALIPGFNSVFSLFNSSYYARWYFMPILLMCLASAKALDEEVELKSGIRTAVAGLIILCFIACLPDMVVVDDSAKLSATLDPDYSAETELRFFGMNKMPVIFWQCIGFSAVFILLVIIYEKKKTDTILKKITAIMMPLVIITNIIYINNSVMELGFDRSDEMSYRLLTENSPDYNDNTYFRTTVINGGAYNNLSMIYQDMNISCFQSIEANEIDSFYYNIQGIERKMLGEYKSSDYPAFGLLSVKYILNTSTGDDLNVEYKPAKLRGFTLYDKQGMYYIYKNDHFVPFGVTYDYCIDDDTLEKYLSENVSDDIRYQYKKMIMMRALILDNEDIEQYRSYIDPLPEYMLESLNEETYFSDCDERSNNSCTSFEYDSKGYRASITVDKPSLVYFSVPCSSGWTAKVNGKDAEVIKAHYGLTAVAVEQGENDIEFSYETPGLKEGKIISIISVIIIIAYSIINLTMNKTSVNLKEKRGSICVNR